MRELVITQCPDPLMWYAALINQSVPLVREEHDCYLSREPSGCINIVRKTDAEIVERITHVTDR